MDANALLSWLERRYKDDDLTNAQHVDILYDRLCSKFPNKSGYFNNDFKYNFICFCYNNSYKK